MIGEYEVANLYTAKCYYAGKQRIDYPNTYSIIAEYTGTATKEIASPYKYTIKYNRVEEKIPDPILTSYCRWNYWNYISNSILIYKKCYCI